jgi:PAS domain S-box-containing protein
MTDSSEAKRVQWTAALAALRCYGIAVISVGIAVGLANTFLYFHLPQPFAAFALSAIAVTFWYGGTKPGILAAVLSMLIRSYFFAPEINTVSRIGYDLVFLIFALLMTGVRRARNDLEVRVTERTAELTRANEDLSREIAERKRAEEKLRQTEAYLAEAQRLSHVGSWAWSAATKDLLHVSEEWRRIYGIAEDEVVPSWEQRIQRIHPLDRERYADVIETAILTKIGYELDCRIVRLDGEMRDVHIVGHPVFGPSGDVVEYMGTVIDTTESKRADESLRRSEAYLSEAQRLTHTGSWVWEVAGREALHLSEEWYRIYGFEPGQGAPVWEQRLQRIHPEDRAKWLEAIDRAISERSDYEVEFRILLPEGEVKHIHTVGHPVLSASGELVQFVGSSTDITERKQAEEGLRQAQADLGRISRVTTIGEFTASLAHEVNQPIAAAVTDANTCLRWLARDQPDVEEAREAASRIVKDAVRASEIINRMRSLFKKDIPQRELVDMNEVIREMNILLRSEATRYSISMRTELSEDLPQIMGDRVQLQQVLMNLMINGIEAMRDVAGSRELTVKSQRAEDEQVMVSVGDTGVGLPPQQRDQIFGAFFTTKRDGTGMGLRISRSIVESHGGRLWATDNSPRGASFCLTLPSKTDARE